MKTIKFKTLAEQVILLFANVFLVTPNAEAHSPLAREASAIVQTINHDKRILTLNYPQGRGTQVVTWNSDTEFICDGKTVPATELKEGTHATIFYHSPFFGKPFATKITWSTSANPNANNFSP
jgi:hypothetical protein